MSWALPTTCLAVLSLIIFVCNGAGISSSCASCFSEPLDFGLARAPDAGALPIGPEPHLAPSRPFEPSSRSPLDMRQTDLGSRASRFGAEQIQLLDRRCPFFPLDERCRRGRRFAKQSFAARRRFGSRRASRGRKLRRDRALAFCRPCPSFFRAGRARQHPGQPEFLREPWLSRARARRCWRQRRARLDLSFFRQMLTSGCRGDEWELGETRCCC